MKVGKSIKNVAIAFAGLFAAYLLLSWLVLPRILQSEAEKYVAGKAGHHLALDRPKFNPFTLKLHLANLHLTEPDGKPLFAFRNLDVDLSLSSLIRQRLVFDEIRLDGPQAALALRRDGRLNWSALLAALQGNTGAASTPPGLGIVRFVLSDGQLDFTDDKAAFFTRIKPIQLEFNDISTLPDNFGNYRLQARTATGANILWQGQMTLVPISATGTLAIDGFDLEQLSSYAKRLFPGKPPVGVAEVFCAYHLMHNGKQFDLKLDKLAFMLKGLRLDPGSGAPVIAVDRLDAKNGRFDLLKNQFEMDSLTLNKSRFEVPLPGGGNVKLDMIALAKLRVDMGQRNVRLESVALRDGDIKAVRNKLGKIDLFSVLKGHADKPEASPAAPWHYRLDALDVEKFRVTLRDESLTPNADFGFDDIAANIRGISDNLSNPLSIRAAFNVRSGGSFESSGKLVRSDNAADFQVKLSGLALKPVQPYLASVAKLVLTDGQLFGEGHVTYDQHGAKYAGGFALNNLRLMESNPVDTLLAWKSLSTSDLQVDAGGLDISTLNIDGLEGKLIINKDKSVNVARILNKSVAEAGSVSPVFAKSVSDKPRTPAFLANIDRIKISNSAMTFADYSLLLPFGTRIHNLRGVISGLSSRPASLGQIELDGQVDTYGQASARGQIDLFNPTDFTDVNVVFRNVEMTRLTPYSSTFAGRRIDSGKLSLDLQYKMKKRQLAGENKIIMDNLVLGDRVESPEAKDLPLDLAIAVLQDANGRINLGLPVSGSLDDPKFNYGSVVWKAFMGVMGKIITAPFRMLGALFGGDGDETRSIAFVAGDSLLTLPEQEKLVQFSKALDRRPGLALTLHGVYSDADKLALQDRQLRRSLVSMSGQNIDQDEDPGPVPTSNPKIQAALERLYAERVGSGELRALKDGYRRANPGQMKQSVGGQVMAGIVGVFRSKHTMSEQEVEKLKGADFYAVLFARLLELESVGDAKLQSLAGARANYLMNALKAAGAPLERVAQGGSEKVLAGKDGVPAKFDFGVASGNSPSAPQQLEP